ncbi:MAG: GNAT family N-acetyltransferase [Deltaproteobacteria bacterium]|nr:GNAT family N-acetyltransferase [Deltaproteobacteria bacterium]
MRVEEVTTLDGLRSIASEWEELWERSDSATPFQRPQWIVPWCRHFGPEDPWVLVARHEGRMTGLAPLFVHRPRDSVRVVSILGHGVTDHLDLLMEPALEQVVTGAFLGHLERQASRWDLCDFEQLRPASPLAWMPLPQGWSEEIEVQEICPVVTLPPSAGDLLRVLPLAVRRKLRYYGNLARKGGPASFEIADRETLPAHLDALFRLRAASAAASRAQTRWGYGEGGGLAASSRIESFYGEAIDALLARGSVRLCALRLCGTIVSSVLLVLGHGRAHCCLGGSDPAFDRLSPGLLTIGFALEEAIRAGARELDFLRDDVLSRDAWGAQDRANRRRRFRHGQLATAMREA